MRAQVLYGIGNLKYADVEKPVAKEGEALVRVSRCGICGSDIPRIFKTGAHNMPLIPGHEMAGVIEECPDRPDLVGKRTGIFPLIPCKKCPQCMAGYYEMCESYDYLGSRSDGGFAEYVKAPLWNLLPVPDAVSDDEAAMLEPMAVAVHAIRQVGLLEGAGTAGEKRESGESKAAATESTAGVASGDSSARDGSPNIVVCGLGTIGLLTVLFLKDAGYQNLFCIGNKDVQREKALAMGIEPENYCDVRSADPKAFIKEKTGGRGADYYFECIGRSESYEQAIDCTGPLGKVMLVGNPASDMGLTRNTYWKILRNQMTLHGTWNSSFAGFESNNPSDDWTYVLKRLESWNAAKAFGKSLFLPRDLITHRYTLEDLPKGLDIMRRKSEGYVKIMCDCNK